MSRTCTASELDSNKVSVSGLTKTEMKRKAQDMIMDKLADVFFNGEYKEGEMPADLEEEVKKQCDRVAKLLGFNSAWYN